jgi:Sugar (and other) transporter
VDKGRTAVAGVEVTAILGAVNVVTTYFAFRWIDKVGRRPLAMFGYAGMTVLHHVVRGRRRRDGLADSGRGVPDVGPRPGCRHRRLR